MYSKRSVAGICSDVGSRRPGAGGRSVVARRAATGKHSVGRGNEWASRRLYFRLFTVDSTPVTFIQGGTGRNAGSGWAN